MTRAKLLGGAFATVLMLLTLAAGYRALSHGVKSPHPSSAAATAVPEEADPSFLYGRINTIDGGDYEGRLRWGGGQEAFWGNYFNGAKIDNPWAAYVPPERLPRDRYPIKLFGLDVFHREEPIDLHRFFMARFGDIARIEAHGRAVRVILKSGTAFELDRFSAGDFDDGVRVWDIRGVVDLDSLRVRTIEFLASAGTGAAHRQLHGTVRTPNSEFTGFLQWDREQCTGSDELAGRSAGGDLHLRFDTIRSIARRPPDSSAVTLLDGREIVLSGTRQTGRGNNGIYVDDPRYGRVLVPWDTFERVDFSPGGVGSVYSDFPPGTPLTGSIVTRAGRRLSGRLVYDLDESEVTETLDAPAQGVDYTIPFGMIASIVLPPGAGPAIVTLHSGEELRLQRTGDLGTRNAGILIFVTGRRSPEYVTWSEVERVELDRPAAMYPPLAPH